MGLVRKTLLTLRQEGVASTAIKTCERVRLGVDLIRAAIRLRVEGPRVTGVEESLTFVFQFSVGTAKIRPMQLYSEIESLLADLSTLKPKRILEIGTANGGTLFLLSRVATFDGDLMTIDLPGGAFGAGYGRDRLPLIKAIRSGGQRLTAIRADSHDSHTLERARRSLRGDLLDVLLIDGDHSYDGVKCDLRMYGPLVRPGGWIVFHDIVPGTPERVGGVPRFWEEVKEKHVTWEYVEDWTQGGWGIGICKVPEEGLQEV